MPKSKITREARPATGTVETMDITREFIAKGVPFLTAGPLFMEAHEALDIQLKFDLASNRGWITTDEAAKIREYMTAKI